MKKYIFLLFSIFLFTVTAFTQSFESYLSKGDSCLNNREFQQAVSLYRKALNLKPEKLITDDKEVIVFFNLGTAYTSLAEYQNALKYFFIYLDKDPVINNNYYKREAYNSIGNSYSFLKKYDLSIEYFKKSLEIIEIDDSMAIARMYNNIADTYLQINEIEQAKSNFTKALNYVSGTNDEIGLLIIYINLGIIALEENKIENAQSYFEQANFIAEERKDTIYLVITKVYQANYYIKIRSYEQAEENLNWALKYAKEKRIPDYLMEAYRSFILLYKAQEKYKEAFNYLNEYKINSDSIFNNNRSVEYENLEIKYAIREKEKETELLRKEKDLTRLQIDTQEKYIWVLAILFAFVTAFLIVLVYQRQKKTKVRAELESKNKEILKSQKQLKDLNYQYEKLIQRYESNEPNKPNTEIT